MARADEATEQAHGWMDGWAEEQWRGNETPWRASSRSAERAHRHSPLGMREVKVKRHERAGASPSLDQGSPRGFSLILRTDEPSVFYLQVKWLSLDGIHMQFFAGS